MGTTEVGANDENGKEDKKEFHKEEENKWEIFASRYYHYMYKYRN